MNIAIIIRMAIIITRMTKTFQESIAICIRIRKSDTFTNIRPIHTIRIAISFVEAQIVF